MLRQLEETAVFFASISEPLHDHRYAAGKWTLKWFSQGHEKYQDSQVGFKRLEKTQARV
jgi:hypothetical protein